MGLQNSQIEVLERSLVWERDGHKVDLVTVVNTFGSSPRPVGTLAAVRHDGLIAGSVSGGCIEKQLLESIRRTPSTESVTYRVSDQEAKRYGLMCGGSIELVFESITKDSKLEECLSALKNGKRITRRIHLPSGAVSVSAFLDSDTWSWDGIDLIHTLGPDYKILIIGAGELSRYVAEFALAASFDVCVIDPRGE